MGWRASQCESGDACSVEVALGAPLAVSGQGGGLEGDLAAGLCYDRAGRHRVLRVLLALVVVSLVATGPVALLSWTPRLLGGARDLERRPPGSPAARARATSALTSSAWLDLWTAV